MVEMPDNAEPGENPRGGYQFRLRTLLIGLALLGVLFAVGRYVADEAKIVAARKAWFDTHPPNGYFVDGSHIYETLAQGDNSKTLSVLRRWLGDFNYREIQVSPDTTPAQLDEITSLFSEAMVFVDRF